MQQEKVTPLMEQYFAIKEQFPDALLLFQVGDFFELFFEDALKAASFLAITLTKRGKHKGADIPLCGIPVHALDHYLTKLVKGGFRVALCEQLTKAQPGVMVQRGVTKVFTPGTLTDASMLEEKSASYVLACYPGQERWGLAFGEILTAQLFATSIPAQAIRHLEAELIRFFPDEVILPQVPQTGAAAQQFKKLGYYTSIVHTLDADVAGGWMTRQFASAADALSQQQPIKQSLTTLHGYLQKHQPAALEQFKQIQFYEPDDYLILDASTQKNLEIIGNAHDGSRRNSLLEIVDNAKTAMGSRTIKKWLQRPLVQEQAINHRLDFIESLKSNPTVLQHLQQLLASCADLERIVGRMALRRALLQDYIALKHTLAAVPDIKTLLATLPAALSTALLERLAEFAPLVALIENSINDSGDDERLIKAGFDHNLDHLFYLLHHGKQAFLSLEQAEIERTGISSLKISYNQITGYYLEVTNPNLGRVPEDYVHVQTLSNRKRFTTPALRALEHDYTKAQTELEAVQQEVFERVKNEVAAYLHQLRHAAQSLAYLDALFGLTKTAYEYGYARPTFNHDQQMHIMQGRHPVVEQRTTGTFEPNDLSLAPNRSTLIITGPNMGGKSTYLRQNALISILAQCGSFVPAQQANLTILDRVFTRIGSGDNLAEGKSTFLVEMEETATICNQATSRSLVILDEVGRGTSTYDGIALAQAILEYIHTQLRAKCLFATHYHELTHLEQTMPGIWNVHAASKRVDGSILFLHKIIPGATEGSFGLHVAQLAGVPAPVIERAHTILQHLTLDPKAPHPTPVAVMPAVVAEPTPHPALERLRGVDCNNLTAKQALDLVWELVGSVGP